HPLHVLHIPDRTLPELLETELDFVFGLGEMGMEMHTVMARQLGGLLHDVRRDGKGRTWRKNDLYHRTGARVMIEFDDALGVPEDGLGAVNHGIRRQSALRGTEGHKAARGLVEVYHLVCWDNFAIQSYVVDELVE